MKKEKQLLSEQVAELECYLKAKEKELQIAINSLSQKKEVESIRSERDATYRLIHDIEAREKEEEERERKKNRENVIAKFHAIFIKWVKDSFAKINLGSVPDCISERIDLLPHRIWSDRWEITTVKEPERWSIQVCDDSYSDYPTYRTFYINKNEPNILRRNYRGSDVPDPVKDLTELFDEIEFDVIIEYIVNTKK